MIIKKEKDFNKIKLKESEKGITLIALVITIIVLLILAVVSIAMLTGENGILSKASNAKKKHLIAQYEEELNLCITEMQTDELGTLTMQKLIENLPQYIQTEQPGEQYEWKTDQTAEEPTGIYKGYEFYVDKNKKAHITGKATGIMISCSVEPSGYTNQNVTATIKITCNEGIQSIKQTKPTEEEAITASGTEYTIVKEDIESNTTFEYEVIDLKGNKYTKVAQVTTIDKFPPKTVEIEVNNIDTGIEINVTAEDEEANNENAKSGIKKYEYYINGTLKETAEEKQYIDKDVEEGNKYQIYVKAYDAAENIKTSETKEIERKNPLPKFEKIASDPDSYRASIALDVNGNIWTWGNNTYGQLGSGDTTSTSVKRPIKITNNTKFKEISMGYCHALALDNEGNIWSWGQNTAGQLGNGEISDDKVLIPTRIDSNVKFKQINAGENCSVALDENGDIWTWGSMQDGALGNGKSSNEKVLMPTKITTSKKFEKIGIKDKTGWAFDKDGEMWLWGANAFGQIGNNNNNAIKVPTKISYETKIKERKISSFFSIAIDEEGDIWTCGDNAYGELGLGYALNKQTVLTFTKVTATSKFEKIAISSYSAFAIDNEGNIWSWGKNSSGELGNGDLRGEKVTKPTQVTNGKVFKEISAGRSKRRYSFG